MTLRDPIADEDWTELDKLVGAELDLVLARHARPAPEPEVEDALFLDQASAFLGRHADPDRLLAELAARLAPMSEEVSATPAKPAVEPEARATEPPDEGAPQ